MSGKLAKQKHAPSKQKYCLSTALEFEQKFIKRKSGGKEGQPRAGLEAAYVDRGRNRNRRPTTLLRWEARVISRRRRIEVLLRAVVVCWLHSRSPAICVILATSCGVTDRCITIVVDYVSSSSAVQNWPFSVTSPAWYMLHVNNHLNLFETQNLKCLYVVFLVGVT